MASKLDKMHLLGLALAGVVSVGGIVVGLVAVYCLSGEPNPKQMIAKDIFAFNREIGSPWLLGGFIVALYLLPRLPSAVDTLADIIVNRLSKVKLGELELTLSPAGAVDGAALSDSGQTVWVSPQAMWSVLASAHQGELRSGKPDPVPTDYAAFPGKLTNILANANISPDTDASKAENRPEKSRKEANKRRDSLHESVWEEIDRAETGWSDEWSDHLERSAKMIEEASPPGGLGEGLGRTLLFRRMMLVDIAVKCTPGDKNARIQALQNLVDCLPKLSNEVSAGFYQRSVVATLFLFLLQDGEKDLFRTLEKGAREQWVDGNRCRYEGGNGGFADACGDAILFIENNIDELHKRVLSGDKIHPTLWAIRVLMRAEALQRKVSSSASAPLVTELSLAVLHGLAMNERSPAPQLRQVAARRLCRSWPHGPAEAANIVASVPEVSGSAACLNDLARALCLKSPSDDAVLQARRYLDIAQTLVEPKSDLERVIADNVKALNAALSSRDPGK
jgi:hypothetical protein